MNLAFTRCDDNSNFVTKPIMLYLSTLNSIQSFYFWQKSLFIRQSFAA